MKAKKILWPTNFNSHEAERFIVSVDGTDFKIWEPKHPTFPIDKGYCSHKFNHAAVKYEIVLAVKHSKCVLINGPFRGGMHDLDMVRAVGAQGKNERSHREKSDRRPRIQIKPTR